MKDNNNITKSKYSNDEYIEFIAKIISIIDKQGTKSNETLEQIY